MGWFSSSSFNTSESMRCFHDKLQGTCAACKNLNEKNYTNGMFSGYKYKCERVGSYVPWTERTCTRIDEVDPGKVDCVDRYYRFSGRKYFILFVLPDSSIIYSVMLRFMYRITELLYRSRKGGGENEEENIFYTYVDRSPGCLHPYRMLVIGSQT